MATSLFTLSVFSNMIIFIIIGVVVLVALIIGLVANLIDLGAVFFLDWIGFFTNYGGNFGGE